MKFQCGSRLYMIKPCVTGSNIDRYVPMKFEHYLRLYVIKPCVTGSYIDCYVPMRFYSIARFYNENTSDFYDNKTFF